MSKRARGVVLTPQGLERLDVAIKKAQSNEKFGQRFTQAELSERSGLDVKTIKRLRSKDPADLKSIEAFFDAFNLELKSADYGLPNIETPEDRLREMGDSTPTVDAEASLNSPRQRFNPPRDIPFQAPSPPYYFVERPEHQNAVKEILLENTVNHPGTLVVSAIYGLGGIGKSVLAMKLAHDPDVLARYADGVLWVTLGQQPDILTLLSTWIQALGDHSYQPITSTAASAHLRTLLADRRMLLVVDDVWNPEHAAAFRVGSSACCVLITTREARIPQARRYPLDVMRPEQSLDLITRKLSIPLSEEDKQQALTFAERVGHLPLALELATSQIEEGVIWSELLEDFQTEVVRLETLDLYTSKEYPDDNHRRNYSLTACFRLSLKQLSNEQLQQFAWLGVLPEDVTLTNEMAMTLWQLPKRVAGAILRTFSAKTLLLQGRQQACKSTTYRMHDLMHDLAQYLLTSPVKPKHAGDLAGLGLTKVQAHSKFIERYQQKTENGQWHMLPDDGYIHSHLTWHLEQAEQFNQIHELLKEETSSGRNGWYEACVALEQTASFVVDVVRAWELAKELYTESTAQAIALQCRYALIKASLNSLASNFPPELIAVLVESGQWSAAKGLAHIQRIPDPWRKYQTLAELLPLLPDSLLAESMKIAHGIQNKEVRAIAIIALSSRIPSLQTNAKETAEAQSNPFVQTVAWWWLASQDISLWKNVIKSLENIQKEDERVEVLIHITPNAPDSYLPDILTIARGIQEIDLASMAMGAIALRMPNLRHEIHKNLLDRVKKIKDVIQRAFALSDLSSVFPELWVESLKFAKNVKHETVQRRLLASIISHIPEKYIDEIIDIVKLFQSEHHKSLVLGTLTKRRPEFWENALDTTKIIEDVHLQISAISDFALEVKSLTSLIFDATQRTTRSYDRAVSLCSLASHDASLWTDAVEATRKIRDVYDRAKAFQALSSEMPQLWPEVLETIQEIQGANYQITCLCDLAPNMPELWHLTIDAIGRLWREESQAHYLYRLANKIPDSQISPAIGIAETIQDKSYRILALSAFVKQESCLLSEIHQALELELFQNDEEHYFTLILGGLALRTPETWPQVIDAIRNIRSEEQKFSALEKLASKIPEDFYLCNYFTG
ncbi:NB-ARC domain protein [Leptolyngbya sp. PCC 7375]|nr:NB-ARC domain protein [Leptolyngbya sp. PCC 7375]